jgi:hypothetical protein
MGVSTRFAISIADAHSLKCLEAPHWRESATRTVESMSERGPALLSLLCSGAGVGVHTREGSNVVHVSPYLLEQPEEYADSRRPGGRK